jgi:hypothetical protein
LWLPIQKISSRNCVAVDSEIGNQIMPLPIQKSAAKNSEAAD